MTDPNAPATTLTVLELFTLGAMVGYCANITTGDKLYDSISAMALQQAESQIAALNAKEKV